jgi:hypothetical protein
MFKIRSNQLVAAVVATGFVALSLGARAESGAQSMDAAACKTAQMSAWFERQRQLTDGDTNPFQAVPDARECAMKYSANGTDGAADAQRREKVAAAGTTRKQELRWDFPGSQSGQ